ncbi:hypothetical protein RR48_01558 [Papilio machaon]|uniref:THAP-type domain-containing protein n=1 Tax=Papilio machaon TaxID=76193 RepID=A0A0N1IB60_PAPMA|nr:hypothetical protein RR48_01558 [Papilio machaon]
MLHMSEKKFNDMCEVNSHLASVVDYDLVTPNLGFRKGDVMRNRWIAFTGRKNWKPSKCDRICSKHFESFCFHKTKFKVNLKTNAVPTLFKYRIANSIQYRYSGYKNNELLLKPTTITQVSSHKKKLTGVKEVRKKISKSSQLGKTGKVETYLHINKSREVVTKFDEDDEETDDALTDWSYKDDDIESTIEPTKKKLSGVKEVKKIISKTSQLGKTREVETYLHINKSREVVSKFDEDDEETDDALTDWSYKDDDIESTIKPTSSLHTTFIIKDEVLEPEEQFPHNELTFKCDVEDSDLFDTKDSTKNTTNAAPASKEPKGPYSWVGNYKGRPTLAQVAKQIKLLIEKFTSDEESDSQENNDRKSKVIESEINGVDNKNQDEIQEEDIEFFQWKPLKCWQGIKRPFLNKCTGPTSVFTNLYATFRAYWDNSILSFSDALELWHCLNVNMSTTNSLENGEDLENVPLVRMEDVQPDRSVEVTITRTEGDESNDNSCSSTEDEESNTGSIVSVKYEEVIDCTENSNHSEQIESNTDPLKLDDEPKTKESDQWPTLEILPGGVIKNADRYEDDLFTCQLEDDNKNDVAMYACAICSESFDELMTLSLHVRDHEQEKKRQNNKLRYLENKKNASKRKIIDITSESKVPKNA